MAALCAAQRLRDHFFHDAVAVQVLRGQLHHLAGFAAAGGILPQDAGKALRAEHRVNGVFQHQDVVGHAQCQCTAGRPLAGDDGNDRNGQAAHLHQVPRNGFALPALLGILAGVCARRVDEGDDGAAELFSLLHQTQGLAVPFRAGHPEVAGQILFQRGPLAVADDGHRQPMEPGHAAQDGAVLLALAVAPLLKEVGEQGGDGLVNVGAVRVPGQKDPVLGGQRAAGTQDLVLLYGKLCQLGGVGRDGVHVVAAALQGGDLRIQRSQLLQNFLDHSCFPPT